MLIYAASRLLTFIGVTLISFAFIRVLPGDPIIVMAGERGLPEKRYAKLSAQFGFDRPIYAQFRKFVDKADRAFQGRGIWRPAIFRTMRLTHNLR